LAIGGPRSHPSERERERKRERERTGEMRERRSERDKKREKEESEVKGGTGWCCPLGDQVPPSPVSSLACPLPAMPGSVGRPRGGELSGQLWVHAQPSSRPCAGPVKDFEGGWLTPVIPGGVQHGVQNTGGVGCPARPRPASSGEPETPSQPCALHMAEHGCNPSHWGKTRDPAWKCPEEKGWGPV
jgi:hypothetical protein